MYKQKGDASMDTPSPIQLIVYSISDVVAAKKLFGAFLGVEPGFWEQKDDISYAKEISRSWS
jgi:hypothetical protein